MVIVSLVASEMGSGKRNNQNQTPMHQATQKLNQFSGARVKWAISNIYKYMQSGKHAGGARVPCAKADL